MTSICVVGVPEDGCVGLTSKAVNAVSSARVVAGHPRHLEWFPQFEGEFLDMTQGYSVWLNQLLEESEEGEVVVLASGDPLFFGIGAVLKKRLPSEELCFIPTQSSPQLAFARLGIAWDKAQYISCHGRELQGLASQMQHGNLFAILTDSTNTPQTIAKHLLRFNQSQWKLSVCENLGSLDETITSFSVQELAQVSQGFDSLNIVVAEQVQATQIHRAKWGGFGQFASDDSFSKRMPQNGLITKQSVRNLALTQLRIDTNDVVWDVGAGSGSIAIEAAKFAYQGKVFAIECNDACFTAIEANCEAHGTDNITLVKDKAPMALKGLPNPDAVFVGGSRGNMELILDCAWRNLNAQGNLVVSAVTVDTVAEVYDWAKTNHISFDAQLINISHLQPLAHYQRYQGDNPIHLFTFTKLDTFTQTAAAQTASRSRSVEQGELQ